MALTIINHPFWGTPILGNPHIFYAYLHSGPTFRPRWKRLMFFRKYPQHWWPSRDFLTGSVLLLDTSKALDVPNFFVVSMFLSSKFVGVQMLALTHLYRLCLKWDNKKKIWTKISCSPLQSREMLINPPCLDRNLPISPARLPTCGEEKVRMVNILSLKSCDAFLSMGVRENLLYKPMGQNHIKYIFCRFPHPVLAS